MRRAVRDGVQLACRDRARAPLARGRATAYGSIVVGALGLWFWGWVVARLAGELSERGKDPGLLIPLVAGLAIVWLASALAGWLAGRTLRAHRVT